jgi:hypothetical protein
MKIIEANGEKIWALKTIDLIVMWVTAVASTLSIFGTNPNTNIYGMFVFVALALGTGLALQSAHNQENMSPDLLIKCACVWSYVYTVLLVIGLLAIWLG